MKKEFEVIDAAFSRLVDQPSQPKLSPRMIWLRGLALERQRAARRSLRIMRVLSAATLLLVIAGGVVFASASTLTTAVDQSIVAVCAAFILGYTSLQLIRSIP
jgi:hypothetical protein